MTLEEITKAACNEITSIGQFIKRESAKLSSIEIEEKDLNSLVSYVDKETEKMLVEKLAEILPESGFLTEEETEDIAGDTYRWIIDPLDGTTNFLYNIPAYCISVALERDGELVVGIIYEVNHQELFYAWKDGGAFMNGEAISVSTRPTLAKSLLATGFPYYDFSNMDGYLKVLRHFIGHTRGLRRIGSAALDLAYVACGRFDGFFEYSLHPWDVAAGCVLVKEAGGQLADFSGGENFLFGKEMVATNGLVHDEMMDTIKQHL